MTTRVVVLDYGSGNLRSAERALARAGADVTVTADLSAAADADGLVVPGVGAYAACVAGIERVGAGPVIAERVEAGRPVLGICVGMQILFERGDEHGVVTKGLGVLPGEVRRLRAERVPHMGWNTVSPAPGSKLFAGAARDARYYFVHSYAAIETVGLVTRAEHGEPFVAAVEHGALSATQFHPEKSGDAGAILLANWVGGLWSKERALRRAAREADTQRRREAEERRMDRRSRWRTLRSRLAPRRGRVGKLAPRYTRTQLGVVVFVVALLLAGAFYLLDSWSVRVALACLALVGLPVLLTLTYDRSTR